MCFPAVLGALGVGGAAAGATAAGATAAAATAGAATAGGLLTTLGTVAAVGGSLWQGLAARRAGRAQAAALETQAAGEARLAAIEEQRTRGRFMTAIAEQRAQLAARGMTLDSPTAVLLGETAAREMAFATQEVRSRGAARQTELSASARLARAQGASGLLRGVFGAADALLSAAPDIWPGLNDPEAQRRLT